jgi:NAD(P)-dependent dehydrogenase (short-subunit alcohol dehydrogenase family)
VTWSIEDRTVIVTGGNSGIGLATATELARRGADVILGARDPVLGSLAAEQISGETGRAVVPMTVDLASFASVRSFVDHLAAHHGRPDVLINNAGVYVSSRRSTRDGYEWTMGVNHLGPYLLTCLLASHASTRPRRIVTVSSEMHRSAKRDPGFTTLEAPGRYRGTESYARSKLANILFTRELARRLDGTGSVVFAAHPGMVATRIAQDGDSRLGALAWKVGSRWMRTPEEGAVTSVYLATEPGIERFTGGYFADEDPVRPSSAGRNDEAAARLWSLSAAYTGCDIMSAGHPDDGTVDRP